MASENAVLGLVVVLALLAGVQSYGTCKFPAIYNFGDSNSDTGGKSAALELVLPPNGETFFHKPAGRLCDGRLVIDFIAEDLRMPYLSPYLDSVGANFRHGANFAASGSSIRPGGFSPFDLGIQISQFKQFKSRSISLRSHPGLTGNLPRPDDFSKALYIFDIGQNDLSYGFQINAPEQLLASLPDILDQYTTSLQDLYTEGARNFWIHNTGPIGCLPSTVNFHDPKVSIFDRNGCVETQNYVAREFNRQLKERLDNLSLEHPDAGFTHFDMYTAKYDLISHAKKQGLTDPFTYCFGSSFDGTPCNEDPSKYVSWDGIHYTEASNRQLASRIINGSLSTPPVGIRNACHSLHP